MKPSFNNNHNKNKKYMIWIIVLASLVVLGAATYFVINNPSILNNSSGSQGTNLESKENEENSDKEPKEQSDVDSSDSESSPQKDDQKPEVVDDNGYIVGQPEATEPTYVDGVLIANKKYPLPKTFQPGEDVDARAAFELMGADARKAGFELVAFSTYRSYEYQQTLYNNYVERDGKENADRYSARPGYSEHQTGLAFDIGEVGREDLWLTSEFGETDAGKWLVNNAHKYGFILRYPQGKEKITGYMYESWHFRYLGIQLATDVKKSSLTLEEYLGIQ
ncbi:D-alanyl-D-alanine carboxypeptidase [Lysinibacillus composti]|uniref:D-alanyl-D-alanine carboxypeptidase family protein n=2 Tax=Lysinibacillus composti TaxID=720633 RepID=A0A3N9U4P5_9BACI|nr:M15 family metallopeptidase [Lysinibacillus composti]MBM7610535.1 D-alanyl-D-alanine carboxypeptidase [Lysinibacillus composti]RQW71587.1 D-alanyl-D-alanine carboxypeptidase family protein [Lysinibacillus composti]